MFKNLVIEVNIFLSHQAIKAQSTDINCIILKVMANLWPDIPVSAFRSTSFESTMRDIFEVESRIAKVTPLVEMRHQVGSYEYVTIAELNTIAPFVSYNPKLLTLNSINLL